MIKYSCSYIFGPNVYEMPDFDIQHRNCNSNHSFRLDFFAFAL